MGLQDLTPHLRTRLSRMERAVGLFVGIAALLLLAGFFYYLYHVAERKGWFKTKARYYVYAQSASGLNVGDPVKLMGFRVGDITAVKPMPPEEWFVQNQYNVFVQFEVTEPNYGYVWSDSIVKLTAGDFLGKRVIEIIKGQTGIVSVIEKEGVIEKILSKDIANEYVPPEQQPEGVWLSIEESPAITDKFDQIVKAVEAAVPALTNQLGKVLENSAVVTSNLNTLLVSAQPIMTNLAEITAQLREPNGAISRWLFSSNFNDQLELVLTNANSALTTLDTNLPVLLDKVSASLGHLAGITSNLNAQVQANTNLIASISAAIVHADEMMQGLQRHWLLRSAFRKKTTNQPPRRPVPSRGATFPERR